MITPLPIYPHSHCSAASQNQARAGSRSAIGSGGAKVSQVQEALASYEVLVQQVFASLKRLEEMLTPVLIPAAATKKEDKQSGVARVPVAETIARNNESLLVINSRINELADRVEA